MGKWENFYGKSLWMAISYLGPVSGYPIKSIVKLMKFVQVILFPVIPTPRIYVPKPVNIVQLMMMMIVSMKDVRIDQRRWYLKPLEEIVKRLLIIKRESLNVRTSLI